MKSSKYADSLTRANAATIEYPKIYLITEQRYHYETPHNTTDVYSLSGIPPRTTCEDMKDHCQKENYTAVSCELGTFTVCSLTSLLKVHHLREVKEAVLKEQKWLAKEVVVPNASCSYSERHAQIFASKIFNIPDGRNALDSKKYILASDLATLAGNAWVTFSIMAGIAEMLHHQNSHTGVLMLNDVLLMKQEELSDFVNARIAGPIKFLILFANVGRAEDGGVFFSSPHRRGSHWTLVYVDILLNKWYYCDTASWTMPTDIKDAISPLVEAVRQKVHMKPKPFNGVTQAHIHNNSENECSQMCLKNIPMQTCSDICGVAVAVMGGIACNAPTFWCDVFLNQNGVLPLNLQWLTSPTNHADFLRHVVISWLLTDCVSISTIGINPEKLPATSTFSSSGSVPNNRKRKPEVEVLAEDDDGDVDNIRLKSVSTNRKRKPEDTTSSRITELTSETNTEDQQLTHNFFVGQTFKNLKELEEFKKRYEDIHYVELWKRDVRTLRAASKRVPRRVSAAKEELHYFSLKLVCKFGGRKLMPKKNKKRCKRSFKQQCGYKVYIALSNDASHLEVKRVSKKHNHKLSKEIYESLPRQRATRNENVVKEVREAFKLNVNCKLLKDHVEHTTGKKVTLKDLSNIKQNASRNAKANELTDVGLSSNMGGSARIDINTNAEKTAPSQAQKFQQLMKSAQVLASLATCASDGGMEMFHERLQVLQGVIQHWKHGHKVSVHVQESESAEGSHEIPADVENMEIEPDHPAENNDLKE